MVRYHRSLTVENLPDGQPVKKPSQLLRASVQQQSSTQSLGTLIF